MSTIKLIVGLGNPGAKHEKDRHNAGFWFVEALAATHGARFGNESKFLGELCQANIASRGVRLLKPLTFMNRSGQSVRAVIDYYRIEPEEVLVAHDELDLPPGTARLKRGGGHGGHNGLRDLISHIGRDFARLRLGVGHPGDRNRVVGYVLQPPGRDEAVAIDDAIRASLDAMVVYLRDGEQKAMHQLHSKATAKPDAGEGGGEGAKSGVGGKGSAGAGSETKARGRDASGDPEAKAPGRGAGGDPEAKARGAGAEADSTAKAGPGGAGRQEQQ